MKSYTDLEQSKKLAEILPLESADMHYNDWNYDFCIGYKHTGKYIVNLGAPTTICGELEISCWSLAALLNVLPNKNILIKTINDEYYCIAKDGITKHYDNLVDVCYEMIIKLHEKGLL